MVIQRNQETGAINDSSLVTPQAATVALKLEGVRTALDGILKDIQNNGWARDEVIGQVDDIVGPAYDEIMSNVHSVIWLLLGDTYEGDVDPEEFPVGTVFRKPEGHKVFIPGVIRPVFEGWLRTCQEDSQVPHLYDFQVHLLRLYDTATGAETEALALARQWSDQLAIGNFDLAVRQTLDLWKAVHFLLGAYITECRQEGTTPNRNDFTSFVSFELHGVKSELPFHAKLVAAYNWSFTLNDTNFAAEIERVHEKWIELTQKQ